MCRRIANTRINLSPEKIAFCSVSDYVNFSWLADVFGLGAYIFVSDVCEDAFIT